MLAAIVGLHLALVGAGQWAADEYYNFGQLRALGGLFFRHRLLHWSPRPISESLVYVYAWVVRASAQPLIGEFLAILWVLLIAAALVHVVRSDRAGVFARILLAVAVLAAFLLGHSVAEMFYWPMGAAAYLPSLAGMTYLTLAILDGQLSTRRGRLGIAIVLAMAAGASELGALFVAAFLPLLFLLHRFRGGPARHLAFWWALLPFGLSLAVLGLTTSGRWQKELAEVAASPTLHHFWPSVHAALVQGGREIVSLDGGEFGWRALLSGISVRVLLFLGFRWCLRRGGFGPVPATHLLALSLALGVACFGSLVASYDLFGGRCCQRHDTFRQCAYVLMLLALAGLGREYRRVRVVDHWAFGPVAILAAALLAFDGRGAELIATYRMYPLSLRVRADTWRQAAKPGPEMEFREAAGPLVHQMTWPAGRFTRDPSTPWYVSGIALFFDKQVVQIAPQAVPP